MCHLLFGKPLSIQNYTFTVSPQFVTLAFDTMNTFLYNAASEVSR